MNLDDYFDKYKAIVDQVDAVFKRVQEEHKECVSCKVGCSDCCHALFDLTLIEALYIKNQFDKVFKENARELIIERANEADRAVYRLKRKAFKDHEDGKPENEIIVLPNFYVFPVIHFQHGKITPGLKRILRNCGIYPAFALTR